MSSTTNSILNLIANVMMFAGGFMFYYHFLTKEKISKKTIYYPMRLFTALLLTGSFSRVLFDISILYTGVNKNFDVLEASIALVRNIGLGGILIYLTSKFK